MPLLGVEAGSYRRPVLAEGTVTVEPNQTVFGILSDCYNISLMDLCTGESIGFAYDCLANAVDAPDCAGGFNLTATTVFTIDSSTLAVRAFPSVVPISATAVPSEYTHITGAFPPTSPVEGLGILEATGVFEGAAGTVRLSGAVNLDVPGQITFSCIFIIDVETSSDIDYEYVFQRAGSKALKQQVFFTLLMTLLGVLAVKMV
jgi:hypothetical protein